MPARVPPVVGAGCTWHWCRRSCRPFVGFPQRTRPVPGEEGAAGPGLGLRGFRANFTLRRVTYHG